MRSRSTAVPDDMRLALQKTFSLNKISTQRIHFNTLLSIPARRVPLKDTQRDSTIRGWTPHQSSRGFICI